MLDDVRRALEDADRQYRSTLDVVLRSYVDDAHLERAVELVRRLVLSIPTSLELLVDLAQLPGVNPAVGALASEALAYVSEAEDLLPESRYGLYGYLDDAYLVHSLVVLAYEALAAGERAKVSVEATRFQKLGKLATLGSKLLPPDVLADLDEKLARARDGVARRLPAKRLPEPSAEASGILDRFAQKLAKRLAAPVAGTGKRFEAVSGDSGAWAITRVEEHFIEHGTRLVKLDAATSETAFAAAQREPGPIQLTVRFAVHAGKEAAFKAALEACAQESRKEPGCLGYALVTPGAPFVLEERWKDGAALAAHTRLPHFVTLGKALEGVLAAPLAIEAFREAA